MSEQDKPVACKHPQIITYAIAEEGPEHGQPAGLWGCAACNRKFAPIDPAPPVAEPALPEPFDYCYEWDGPYGKRKFSSASHNGARPARSVPIFRADQMQAYARAAIVADRAARVPLTDAELSRIAYKGYDDYWAEDCPGLESEAWAASARAVLAATQGSKT